MPFQKHFDIESGYKTASNFAKGVRKRLSSGLVAQFLWVAHTVLAAGCHFDRTLDGDPGPPLLYEIDKTMEAWRQVGSIISDTRSTCRTTARIYFDRAK